ncbi:Csu type fimbrial protein [Pontixanthobacter sp.]|uniref:Csu type fimbrial protein n=1 Tax=Pontixanthobacter sp. TaxID=2792078 RepID=UPI003C7C4FFD
MTVSDIFFTTRRTALSGAGLMAAAMAVPAHAETDTYVLGSEITILNGCTIMAAPMAFGVITGTAVQPTTTAEIYLQCNPNVDYEIAIDNGQNANRFNRRMRNPVDGRFLRYKIYQDAAMTQLWDSRNRRRVVGNSGATGIVSHTAYGEIRNPNFASRAGGYYDTVTVSVEF